MGHFRETTLAVYVFVLASMAAYTFTFKLEHIAVTFVTAGVTGYTIVFHEFKVGALKRDDNRFSFLKTCLSLGSL